MPSTRFESSSIKNKVKRQEITRKLKREKGQRKLRSRLAIAKAEATDPAAKKVCLPPSRSWDLQPNEVWS
jgi:ribosome production factor 1